MKSSKILQGRFPNTYYRVSAKALIKNDTSDILCIKEGAEYWELPGGGIDFGEDARQTLARELKEEISYHGDFDFKFLGWEQFFDQQDDVWKLKMVYRTELENFNFRAHDATTMQWLRPEKFADSKFDEEKLIYKYGTMKNAD